MPDEEIAPAVCSVTHSFEAPDGDARTVNVTFTDGVVTHIRDVNAVFTDGAYDAEATEVRVGEVAWGVESKIAVGAISMADPITEPEESS